jgi:hypothetical protein
MLNFLHAYILGNGATDLTDQVRAFVAPFVLIATSLISITFLVKRQMTQFLTFLIIAVAVFAIFYAPGLLANLGKSAGESNQNLTWQ